MPIRRELRDARRQPIEHVALRILEADEIGLGLLDLLDVDRIAGDPARPQRHVDDAQRAPFAADRRGHGAHRHLALVARGGSGSDRAARPLPLDQFQPALDHGAGIRAVDRADIGRIDQAQPEVGPAMPHRDRRRLDQPGERVERLGELLALGIETRDLVLALGRVEQPEQRRAFAQHLRGRTAAHHQHTPGAGRPHRTGEARAAALRDQHIIRQRLGIGRIEPRAQIGQRRRCAIEAEPVAHSLMRAQPAVRRDQHGKRRRARQHLAQPRQLGDRRLGGMGTPPAIGDGHHRRRQPDGQDQPHHRRVQRIELDHATMPHSPRPGIAPQPSSVLSRRDEGEAEASLVRSAHLTQNEKRAPPDDRESASSRRFLRKREATRTPPPVGSVAVVIRLERAFRRHADIVGLLLGQLRELHAQLVEMEAGHLLVEMLGQDIDLRWRTARHG